VALRDKKVFLLKLLNSRILHADKCEVIWGRHIVLIPSDLLVDTVIYTCMWLKYVKQVKFVEALTFFVDWLSPELYIKRFHFSKDRRLSKWYLRTRGADKSLTQPGRIQARKHVRDVRDFNNIETRAVIKVFPARQGAEGDLRHSDRNISLFPP